MTYADRTEGRGPNDTLFTGVARSAKHLKVSVNGRLVPVLLAQIASLPAKASWAK